MILGIDASNIRAGGGVTHLFEMLRSAQPAAYGFERVVVWASSSTLAKLEDRPWLVKQSDALLEGSLLRRIVWQRFRLRQLARAAGCDLLFVPGGSDASDFQPMVTMNQNLLPFEWRELRRYGLSLTTLKFALLRVTQRATFRKAAGVIYLSQYAWDVVAKVIGQNTVRSVVVPHGINPRFSIAPRPQRELATCSEEQPLRLLYVSIVDVYKHQWHVAEAVARLRVAGYPVCLDLVGPAGAGISKLNQTLRRLDPEQRFIRYQGAMPYDKLHELYAAADIAIFASSCETFGQILTEAMAAGLAIACSERGPMPELLADAGLYFDPEDVDSIQSSLQRLIVAPALRAQKAQAAFERARLYSWQRCSMETFKFLAETAGERRRALSIGNSSEDLS